MKFILVTLLNLAALVGAQFDYIVIGAGFSGLQAATEIKNKGKTVVVLEAKNYVGGRVKTIQVGGATVDSGAMWLDGKSKENPVKKLADLSPASSLIQYEDWTLPYSTAPCTCYDNVTGQAFPLSEFQGYQNDFINQLSTIRSDLSKQGNPDASMDQGSDRFITKNSLTGKNARRAEFAIKINLCDSYYSGPSQITGLNEFWEDYEFSGGSYMFPNGFSQLVNKLATPLDIRTSTVVTSVTYTSTSVSVKTSTGATYTAKKVIVSVPLGVLKANTIEFSPPLPSAKVQAINRLGMGTLEKVIITFNTRPWPSTSNGNIIYVSNLNNTFGSVFDISSVTGKNTVVAWHGGYESTETLKKTDAQIVRALIDEMSVALNVKIPMPPSSNYWVSRWQEDPYIRGSYSFIPVPSDLADMDTLAETVSNTVIFNGEATNKYYYGTTHGALLAGTEAGKRALA